jgi:hypothetical protein
MRFSGKPNEFKEHDEPASTYVVTMTLSSKPAQRFDAFAGSQGLSPFAAAANLTKCGIDAPIRQVKKFRAAQKL